MTQFRSVDDIRRFIERRLKKPIPDWVWEYITAFEDVYLRDILDGDAETLEEEIIPRVKTLLKVSKSPAVVQPNEKAGATELPPDRRLETLGRVVAAQASKDSEITRFREDILGGRLLKPEEAAQWIREMAAKEGHTVTISFDVPAEDWRDALLEKVQQFLASGGNFIPGMGERVTTLAFVSPPSEWVEYVPIRKGGVLHRLKKIARKLVWSEPRAVLFILTGEVPPIPLATTGIEIGQGPYPRVPRVKLNVAPHIKPDEVAKLYAQARRKLAAFSGVQKYQPLSEKTMALAVFAAGEDGSWAEKMAKWNKKNPQWGYSDRRRFARDAKKALRLVQFLA